MNCDNADVTHQVSSEIAIEAKVVVDDRGHTQTVNRGIGCDVPTMMFVTVIGVMSHQNATQQLITQIPTVCRRRKESVCATCQLGWIVFYCHK